jgi:hypothetical protein
MQDIAASRAADNALTDAMALLRGEVEQNENEVEVPIQSEDEFGKNRRVVMFTKERMGNQSDDGFTSPIKKTKTIIPTRAPKTPKKKRSNRQEIVSTKIELCGWIFSHLAALHSNILPLESISLSQVQIIFIYSILLIYNAVHLSHRKHGFPLLII